jgi:hypothetical protein
MSEEAGKLQIKNLRTLYDTLKSVDEDIFCQQLSNGGVSPATIDEQVEFLKSLTESDI